MSHVEPDPLPGPVERNPPVHAHHVGPGVPHQREQLARTDAEVVRELAQFGQPGEHLARRRQDEVRVVLGIRAPAHESNTWTAATPADTWARR